MSLQLARSRFRNGRRRKRTKRALERWTTRNARRQWDEMRAWKRNDRQQTAMATATSQQPHTISREKEKMSLMLLLRPRLRLRPTDIPNVKRWECMCVFRFIDNTNKSVEVISLFNAVTFLIEKITRGILSTFQWSHHTM